MSISTRHRIAEAAGRHHVLDLNLLSEIRDLLLCKSRKFCGDCVLDFSISTALRLANKVFDRELAPEIIANIVPRSGIAQLAHAA